MDEIRDRGSPDLLVTGRRVWGRICQHSVVGALSFISISEDSFGRLYICMTLFGCPHALYVQ